MGRFRPKPSRNLRETVVDGVGGCAAAAAAPKKFKISKFCGAAGDGDASTDPVDDGFARVLGENGPNCFLKMIVFIAAIEPVKFSSKSELSSRFFDRLKFSVPFEVSESDLNIASLNFFLHA